MNYYGYEFIRGSDLAHHGIKGQKWGIRRFQNEDGSLTVAGEKRYYGKANRIQRDIDSFKGLEKGIYSKSGRMLLSSSDVKKSVSALEAQRDKARAKGDAKRTIDAAKAKKMNDPEHQKRAETMKKVVKVGAAVAGTALVAYGGYKLNKLATESLKAGDRYMAKQKDAMGDLAFKSYFEQMKNAEDYRGHKPITDATPKEVADKFMRMVDTAHEAGSKGQRYYNEARQLLDRADAGKYSAKEKIDELRRMARR